MSLTRNSSVSMRMGFALTMWKLILSHVAHIQSKRFNCQHLRIDTRNDTEPVMICIEESNQASMAHGQRRRSNEWNRAHAVTPGHRSLNNQAPLQDSEAAPPDHDARSLPGNTSDADAAGTTYNDVLAAVERVCATNLREAMQNITFYTPPFPCPYYAWLYYHNMNPPVPFPYGGPPVLFSPQLEMLQPGMPLHGDVPYGAQLSPDESQGGERRSDSQPPGSSNNLS